MVWTLKSTYSGFGFLDMNLQKSNLQWLFAYGLNLNESLVDSERHPINTWAANIGIE